MTRAYLIYFKQMNWIKGGEEGLWTITDKGKEALAALSDSPPPSDPNDLRAAIYKRAKKLKLT